MFIMLQRIVAIDNLNANGNRSRNWKVDPRPTHFVVRGRPRVWVRTILSNFLPLAQNLAINRRSYTGILPDKPFSSTSWVPQIFRRTASGT